MHTLYTHRLMQTHTYSATNLCAHVPTLTCANSLMPCSTDRPVNLIWLLLLLPPHLSDLGAWPDINLQFWSLPPTGERRPGEAERGSAQGDQAAHRGDEVLHVGAQQPRTPVLSAGRQHALAPRGGVQRPRLPPASRQLPALPALSFPRDGGEHSRHPQSPAAPQASGGAHRLWPGGPRPPEASLHLEMRRQGP